MTPDDVSQSYIGEVLGVPAEDVDPAMWPDWLPAADGGVIPLGPASTVPALREAMTTTMNRSRRSFMTAIAGTSLITLAGAWASADTQAHAVEQARVSKSVDEEVVTFLEETSARLTTMATEHRQHVAPLLDAHLTTVANLIAEGRCTRPVKVRLLALAANLSQTVAWHRFDLGLHIEASKYWVAGLHCAHQGGDRDMAAALLSDLAYQASWQDNPRTASGILERALSRTRHPAARSLLQLRLARALAAQGERKGTFRALAAAEHLLDAACGEPVPAWCAWFSEADLAVDSGQCLRDLGDTRRAHELIREGHSLLPPSRDKTRGIFLLYQAQNHLDVGEPDLAAAAGLESLLLAQRIGAPRCVQLVREFIPRFEGYREIQGVPELLDRVAA